MIRSGEARGIARRMIKENPALLIGSSYAYLGITLGLSLFPTLSDVNLFLSLAWAYGCIFISVPLALGHIHINNMIVYKRPCAIGNLFDFFRNYNVSIRVIGINAIFMLACTAAMSVIMIPLVLIMMIPLVASGMLGSHTTSFGIVGAAESTAMMIFGAILLFLLAIAVLLITSSFFMSSYYIALRNRSLAFGRLLSSSLRVGAKYLGKYALLQLSFAGWYLLAILPAMLLMLLAVIPVVLSGSLTLSIGLTAAVSIVMTACMALLQVYTTAASTVFFNAAIDEYDRNRPAQGEAPAWAAEPRVFHVAQPPADPALDAPAPQEGPAEHVEAGRPEESGEGMPLCDVILVDPGIATLTVTQIVADAAQLSADEARDLVNEVKEGPRAVRSGIPREQALEIAKRLTDAGARVEIQ